MMAAAPAAEPAAADRANRANRGNRGGPGQVGAAIRATLEKPEVQSLIAVQQKAALDTRYAALFKNLNLPAEQLDKLKTLLVEKQTAMQDVLAVARAQGVNPRDDPEGFRKLVASAQSDIDNNIRATLGEQGFSQYEQYQQTLPQRAVVNQLQQRLSYSGAPLSDAQSEQLVQILASTAPQRADTNNGGGDRAGRGGFGGGFPGVVAGGMGDAGAGRTVNISKDAVNLSQSVLQPAQVQALQQLRDAQQAQQQLQKIMREATTAQRNTAKGDGTTEAAPKTQKKAGNGG
jgi:hypothetical protein